MENNKTPTVYGRCGVVCDDVGRLNLYIIYFIQCIHFRLCTSSSKFRFVSTSISTAFVLRVILSLRFSDTYVVLVHHYLCNNNIIRFSNILKLRIHTNNQFVRSTVVLLYDRTTCISLICLFIYLQSTCNK